MVIRNRKVVLEELKEFLKCCVMITALIKLVNS